MATILECQAIVYYLTVVTILECQAIVLFLSHCGEYTWVSVLFYHPTMATILQCQGGYWNTIILLQCAWHHTLIYHEQLARSPGNARGIACSQVELVTLRWPCSTPSQHSSKGNNMYSLKTNNFFGWFDMYMFSLKKNWLIWFWLIELYLKLNW